MTLGRDFGKASNALEMLMKCIYEACLLPCLQMLPCSQHRLLKHLHSWPVHPRGGNHDLWMQGWKNGDSMVPRTVVMGKLLVTDSAYILHMSLVKKILHRWSYHVVTRTHPKL